jgi:hypothetical protein
MPKILMREYTLSSWRLVSCFSAYESRVGTEKEDSDFPWRVLIRILVISRTCGPREALLPSSLPSPEKNSTDLGARSS